MKIKLLNLPYSKEISNEVLINGINLNQVSDTNKEMVNTFLMNHIEDSIESISDKTFIYTFNDGKCLYIFGLISFDEVDIRTEFPETEVGETPMHFNRISNFIIDERLLDEQCLIKLFRNIFSRVINREDKTMDEIIWCNYKKQLIAKKLEHICKSEDFYFQNISEYFVSKLIECIKQDEKHETYIIDLMKKAGL